MERKIGEIFECNGEWCQCVEGNDCANCVFIDYCKSHAKEERDDTIGLCVSFDRNDRMHVIFKKLEKVGEPMEFARGLYFQRYRLAYSTAFYEGDTRLFFNAPTKTFVYIEIKQNKEDMEDLDKIKVRDYTKVEELNVMEEKKLNLKPFDLQKAREGKPVCTRDGHKARIICFDKKEGFPIVALVETRVNDRISEEIALFNINGRAVSDDIDSKLDLMMLTEKKEGWVNAYMEETNNNERLIEQVIYKTRKDAFDNACPRGYKATAKIEWEE